jgi:hypothetical protein
LFHVDEFSEHGWHGNSETRGMARKGFSTQTQVLPALKAIISIAKEWLV